MSNRNNVIDLNSKRAKTSQEKDKFTPRASVKATVFDMTERRQAALQEERRAVRRTILSEFVGAFAIIPGYGLKRVGLYDISENGLSFDLDFEVGGLRVGEELAMRLYLSQHTYFPFVVSVTNVRDVAEEGVVRHGGTFIRETVNEQALFHFVKFIENVSLDLKKDSGDLQKRFR